METITHDTIFMDVIAEHNFLFSMACLLVNVSNALSKDQMLKSLVSSRNGASYKMKFCAVKTWGYFPLLLKEFYGVVGFFKCCNIRFEKHS